VQVVQFDGRNGKLGQAGGGLAPMVLGLARQANDDMRGNADSVRSQLADGPPAGCPVMPPPNQSQCGVMGSLYPQFHPHIKSLLEINQQCEYILGHAIRPRADADRSEILFRQEFLHYPG